MRILLLALVTISCHREPRAEVRRDPTPPAPSPSASAPSPGPPTTRVRGDIDGALTLANANVVVGEPIVVALEVKPRTAPLRVFVGGDQRNAANYPMRFAVRATDEAGAVVCDLVEKPAIASFGGIGSDREIAAGDVWRERVVLNSACPALASPGRYAVTVHRRITTSGMVVKTDAGPTSCDVVPVHETTPKWLDPRCVALLDAAPSLTADFTVTVAPFDADVVRKRTASLLREAGATTPRDELLRHRVERFICGSLSCACPKTSPVADGDIVASIGAKPAATYPAFCP